MCVPHLDTGYTRHTRRITVASPNPSTVENVDTTPRRDGTTTIDGWRTSDARGGRWYWWNDEDDDDDDDDDDGDGIGHARSVSTMRGQRRWISARAFAQETRTTARSEW